MFKGQLLLSIFSIMLPLLVKGQANHTFYKTENSTLYSQKQYDSLLSTGLPIGKVSKNQNSDSTIWTIKIYKNLNNSQRLKNYKGKSLPNLTFKTLSGKLIHTKDLKGKVVMINFWSTTCGPCVAEIPQLNKLAKTYQDKVVFLAPLPENVQKAKVFLGKHPYHFLIVPDAQDIFDALEVKGYPKNLFINKQGIIEEIKEGTPRSKENKNAPWHISVFEDYSKILEDLL